MSDKYNHNRKAMTIKDRDFTTKCCTTSPANRIQCWSGSHVIITRICLTVLDSMKDLWEVCKGGTRPVLSSNLTLKTPDVLAPTNLKLTYLNSYKDLQYLEQVFFYRQHLMDTYLISIFLRVFFICNFNYLQKQSPLPTTADSRISIREDTELRLQAICT